MSRRTRRRGKKTLRQQVRSHAAKLNQMNQVERKYKDIALHATSLDNVNTTGSVHLLTPLQQGATRITRVGTRVSGRRLMIRGHFANNHGTPEDCIIRIMLVKMEDVNAAAPAITDILDAIAHYAPREINNKENFKVLYDHSFAMDTALHTKMPFKINKLLNTKIEYKNAQVGDVTDCLRNHYFLIYFSDIAGTTNCPQVSWYSRFVFTDE